MSKSVCSPDVHEPNRGTKSAFRKSDLDSAIWKPTAKLTERAILYYDVTELKNFCIISIINITILGIIYKSDVLSTESDGLLYTLLFYRQFTDLVLCISNLPLPKGNPITKKNVSTAISLKLIMNEISRNAFSAPLTENASAGSQSIFISSWSRF